MVYYRKTGSPIPLLIEWKTTPVRPTPSEYYDYAANIKPNKAKIISITIFSIKLTV